ncbi:MAG: hypothetical protein PWR31_1598 [Bacillota bacterium]|nr:hypothetical protein [Bacillota bacterium]
MKRWYLVGALLLAAALAGAGAGAGHLVGAAAPEPGSDADPLVAKSYVDRLAVLQVLELESGQTVRAAAGTELILRAGRAAAVTSPQGGLADLTAGRDIQAGEAVPVNHLLLIPRGDGRGLKALTPAVILVRGGATVE